MMIGASFCALTALTGCSKGNDENKVLIYTSAEDYRVEDLKKVLTEQFPDYDITIDYRNTGSHAASLLAEGADTEADITFDLEYPYLKYSSYRISVSWWFGHFQFTGDPFFRHLES